MKRQIYGSAWLVYKNQRERERSIVVSASWLYRQGRFSLRGLCRETLRGREEKCSRTSNPSKQATREQTNRERTAIAASSCSLQEQKHIAGSFVRTLVLLLLCWQREPGGVPGVVAMFDPSRRYRR